MTFGSRWRACALLALVYVVAGMMLRLLQGTTAFIWPPVGISVAAILLYGPRLWPGVAIGTFLTVMLREWAPLAALWLAFAGVCEVLLVCWLLRTVLGFHPALDRVRDVLALAAVAVVTSLVSVVMSITGLFALGLVPIADVDKLIYAWWWSHISADLVIAPLILTWLTKRHPRDVLRHPSLIEVGALAATVVLADFALFNSALRSWMPGSAAPFYLMPLMVWAGMRFGPRGAAAATFWLGSMSIVSAITQVGPFKEVSELETFVSVTSVATLMLSAMSLEKVRAVQRWGALRFASLDAIVSIDGDGRILEFNPAAEQLFGYREEQVLRKDAAMLAPDNQREAFDEILRDDRDGVIGRRYRAWAARVDGTKFPVEIAIAASTFDGENVRTGFIRDLTREHLAEKERTHARVLLEEKVNERTAALTRSHHELERREVLLRQAEELAQLGSFELEMDTCRFEWSDELYRIYGRDPATFSPTYESFINAVHPDDRASVRRIFDGAIANRLPFALEKRIVRPDGCVRHIASRGRVFYNGTPKAVRVAGCVQDVTDRQAAEAARYRLVDIVESSEDAIIGLSVTGTIESWNAAAANIFGFQRDEILGRPCIVLSAPEHVRELEDRLRLTAAGQHLSHYELPHIRKDGTVFDASVTTSAIRDRHGTVIGLSNVLRDITNQKNFQNQLRLSLEEKEVLLREIHHRVKNNLQVISSLLNLQVASETSEQSRRSLLESQNRIQSMALVHQLLYRSRDLGHIELTSYSRTLTTRLLTTYSVEPDRIELIVDGPPMSLDIDRVIPCGLILNELVANAIEHAFPGERRGHIWVTLTRERDAALALTVRDDGVGIPTGLPIEDAHTFGLQIARTLTKQLGGSIMACGDHGTTVRVVFPFVAPAEPARTN